MKIIHGTQGFGYAEINTAGSQPEFGKPKMLEGMKSITVSVEESRTSIYADNTKKGVLQGARVTNAEATVFFIPESYNTDCLGFKANKSGMVTDTAKKKQHCIFFETIEEDMMAGTATPTLHYLYDVLANAPEISSETDADEATPSELTIPYEAKPSEIAKDDNGIAVQYGYLVRTEENKDLYDSFKTKVILPADGVTE